MGAPEHNVPFQMPMIREFVPAKAGPWIYLVIAVTFQLSGGVYAGTMEGMRGATAFMREDIMMYAAQGTREPYPNSRCTG